MAFDTKKWLIDDLGFSAEDAEAMLPKFADRADKLEKGYLRQSDYSKSMNDVSKTQKALDDANAKLNGEMAEWAELTAAEQTKATALRERIEKSDARAFELEQKLTRVAEENGIDPKTLLGTEPAKPAPKAAEFDADGFSKTFDAKLGGIANYMLDLNAELPAIAQEHFELTGERLDTRAFIAGIKDDIKTGKTGNLDPVKRWEAQYQIPTKRSEKATKDIDQRIATARAEERQSVLSEQSLPNTQPRQGTHSPLFTATQATSGSVLKRPQPSQRMAGAVAALATGKYRKSAA